MSHEPDERLEALESALEQWGDAERSAAGDQIPLLPLDLRLRVRAARDAAAPVRAGRIGRYLGAASAMAAMLIGALWIGVGQPTAPSPGPPAAVASTDAATSLAELRRLNAEADDVDSWRLPGETALTWIARDQPQRRSLGADPVRGGSPTSGQAADAPPLPGSGQGD
jgi:hypothetical protein